MKYGLKILALMSLFVMVGCTKINSSQVVPVNANAGWGIAVFANNTEVPQAGYRAMNITTGVLRSKGVHTLVFYPSNANCNKLIVCPNATPSVNAVLSWARERHLQYVVMGAVNEWDYKVGLDGEPIAGVSLQIFSVPTGQMIWSSVGSKMGTSRSGLAVIAQRLIDNMLFSLKIS
ncbi:hypothetical protein Lsai_1115 [Legionella sainthelensi]|uniref:Lipoprotein n=1 Tax=Legionella sainthelensi TaxID=28087 RepID=A0A0W0YNL7_9GAMM|nr:hypothetical protein [Legionella sainthelensi]KTD58508.1 hypothetical protein Lsai_1115 [Legionella sainthelensi]VEH27620.1 Uncharacterised protein [Legionella sainthelensi]